MKSFIIQSYYLFIFITGIVACANGQTRLVLNGARVNITNGANLVIENGASNAISRVDGYIISEGELNTVIWETGTTTGTYVVPWGYGTSDYLPLTFTKSAGTGNGRFVFSTYHTGWQNSLYLPSGVSNVNNGNTDFSAFIVDRYWQVNAQNYTVKPALTNFSFTYLEEEHTVPQNTIQENSLAMVRWNNNTSKWNALGSNCTIDINTNIVTGTNVQADELSAWWTLFAGQVALTNHFLDIEVRRESNKTKLIWRTINELNVNDFEVQRSVNGRDFKRIGTVKAIGTTGINEYHFYDEQLQAGKLFYRIKENGNDGSIGYSEIRMITINDDQLLSVYPNPVRDKKIMLNTTGLIPGQYQISLFDVHGKLFFQSNQVFNRNIVPLHISQLTSKGTYYLKIIGGETIIHKVILIN